MAAVSPAFRPTTRRITTPITIAAFVASRRVFFSLIKSAALSFFITESSSNPISMNPLDSKAP